MTPSLAGTVELVITDVGIEIPFEETAILHISDIFKIELIGGGIIQEGDELTINFNVYDQFGKMYDESQLKYMKFNTFVEKIGVTNKNGLEFTLEGESSYKVFGKQSGNFRVFV